MIYLIELLGPVNPRSAVEGRAMGWSIDTATVD